VREVAMGILVASTPWALGQRGAPSHAASPPSSLSPAPPSAERLQMISSGRAVVPSAGPDSAPGTAAGDVVKEIDDPENGNRWLLMRDPSHPSGPGLLRLAGMPASRGLEQQEGARHGEPAQASLPPTALEPAPVLPVIRAGDRIMVEQHTRVVDARLEAVAISPARAGAVFRARLLMGGGMIRAVAVAAGRATMAEETER